MALGRGAARELAEDPHHDRGLRGIDRALPGRDGAAVERLHDGIPIRVAAARLTRLDAPAKSAACLVGQLREDEGIHRPLEPGLEGADRAFGERDDPHAVERQPLEQGGRVLDIATEAVERFGHDDIVAGRVADERQETGAMPRGARHRGVAVLLDDRPVLARHERATVAELIIDRGRALLVGAVPRVESYSHGTSSLGAAGLAPCCSVSKKACAACRAIART